MDFNETLPSSSALDNGGILEILGIKISRTFYGEVGIN